MRFCTVSAILGFVMLAFATAGHTSDAVSVEVVQSFPIETTLEVPGISQTQQVWVDMINQAQSTIDVEQFYMNAEAGQALDSVLAALTAAANRGVRIRILVDLSFYKDYSSTPDSLALIPNISVKTIDFSSLGGVQHSKFFVIDGNQFYEGSANFDWLALTHIHEVGLHITNAALASGLESIFEMDWQNQSETHALASSTPSVTSALSTLFTGILPPGFQLMASPPAQTPSAISDSLQSIEQLLASAHRSVQIQLYEYDTKIYGSSTRWHDLDNAIRQTAARGVPIELAVDQTALKAGKADLEALAKLNNIQVRVVTVPQWSGGYIPYARLIHSKYFIVDGQQAWVGTENWDMSYFTGSRNVGIILNDTAAMANLGMIFNQVWNSAYTSAP